MTAQESGLPGPARRHSDSSGAVSWRWLAAWAVLTALAILAFRSIAWREAMSALLRARPGWLVLGAAANLLILAVAARQWLAFLPPGSSVRFRTMFWIQAMTSTISNGGPFPLGHAAAVHLLADRGGLGYETGLSVKALDQLAEGVVKLALILAVVLAVPLPFALRTAAVGLLLAVSALAIGVVASARGSRALERWASNREGRTGRWLGFLSRLATRLEVIRDPRTVVAGVTLGLGRKAAEGAAIWAVAHALGVALPAWGLLLVLTSVALSTTMSLTPGNLGIYEGAAFAAYRTAGVGAETALGLAVLQHIAYLVPMAGTGWVLLAIAGLGPRQFTPFGHEEGATRPVRAPEAVVSPEGE